MSARHDALVIAGTLAAWVVVIGACVGVVVLADRVFSAAMRWFGC